MAKITKYVYKGRIITHTDFISLLHRYGLNPGYRKIGIEHLKELADNGNEKAIDLLKDIQTFTEER